jgi:hypothetical protein
MNSKTEITYKSGKVLKVKGEVKVKLSPCFN